MEPTHPCISNTFRLPKTNSDEVLINFARAVVVATVPFKSEFLQYELPATFIEDLAETIEEFEEATGIHNERAPGKKSTKEKVTTQP